jgi:HAD superfamily hydrolase (TIGR01509 family)
MKVLLTDIGDVLVSFNFKVFLDFVESRNGDITKDRNYFQKYKSKVDEGTLELKTFWEGYIMETGVKASVIELREQSKKTLVSNLKMITFLEKVNYASIPIIIASNTDEATFEEFQRLFNMSLFNKTYLSYEMKKLKRDPLFFIEILQNEELEPKEILFIDDSKEIIDTAKSLGIQTHLFTNVPDFLKVANDFFEFHQN